MLKIFTDTDTDITLEEAKKYGYDLISMPYVIDDKEIKPYEDFEVFDYEEFYNVLRKGVLPTTCAINPEKYREYFEPTLAEGHDILYVHFSKAMSGTFNAMNIALEELKEEYPDRTVYTIDTKGITILSLNIVKIKPINIIYADSFSRFNPTMKVSMGIALPLFAESEGELVDIEILDNLTLAFLDDDIDSVVGFLVVSCGCFLL